MEEQEKFKNIHIGKHIQNLVKIQKIEENRIENFFKLSYVEIAKHFEQEHISTEHLLKWCKLLKYDFFRFYSSHLMMYHGISISSRKEENKDMNGILIRKNIYTHEIKEYIIQKVQSGNMDVVTAIDRYGIGRTTLYRWLAKKF